VTSGRWYARSVVFVADLERAVAFYVGQLGFVEAWRHEQIVAQVERAGCELIVTAQEPDKRGRARVFISLDPDVLDAVRAELAGRGVAIDDGDWGYRTMIVRDPDGNELYFPYPAD
jgi:catechol 2,3-dioxygenase-like lactoylglutathione lyase family enzyme